MIGNASSEHIIHLFSGAAGLGLVAAGSSWQLEAARARRTQPTALELQ